ncbi:hypothetical protein SLE2022_103100 [Rubroshorea leprosula]
MATTISQASSNHADEEDYVDMEVSSSSKFLCYSLSSPPRSMEFEFQMCSVSLDGGLTTSPADELFYKGKLLPLHLPPRLQMVQKLLQSSNTAFDTKTEEQLEESCSTPFMVAGSATPSTNTSTPLESCSISPSESCRVSSELNPDEYFFEWSTEMSGFIGDNSKKSWGTRIKQIKHSSLGQKLKASRAYIRSLFSKSACSDESCARAASSAEAENVLKIKDCLNKYTKVGKKNPFGRIDNERYKIPTSVSKSMNREMIEEGGANSHRRSFSGAIQRHSASKYSSTSTSSSGSSSSSSPFSFSSNGFYELQFLKRSCSANSELESSIEGAIAHCKQSQQMSSSRKTVSVPGVCSLSASRIVVSGGTKRGLDFAACDYDALEKVGEKESLNV